MQDTHLGDVTLLTTSYIGFAFELRGTDNPGPARPEQLVAGPQLERG